MKLKIRLYTRILFWVTILLICLVGIIVFVIQRKEVQTISQETRNRGILTAQYIANLNLRSLILWDEETLRRNVEDQADDKLIYIVFYDRNGKPRAANRLVEGLDEITCCSLLQADSRPDSFFIRPRNVKVRDRMLNVLEIELPVFVTGSPSKWASIKIGQSLEDMRADVRRTRLVLIAIGFGGLLIGMLGSAFLAKRITMPLHELVEGTIRISRGDFSHRIRLASKDEVGDLARSFNEMTDRLLEARECMEAANRRLVQAEKLASIGRLAATIAHEIRNPLTSVKLNIQKIAEEESFAETIKAHLGLSLEGIDQIEGFIKQLLNFTRVQELSLERWPIEQIVKESLKLLRETLARKKVVVETTYSEGLPQIHIDGDKMRQVFLNVLRNAHEALEAGGKISIVCEPVEEGGKRKARIRISDNGPGIPEKDWENIFEPFFSTKPSGFGLGLANARKIVEQHNGTIRVGKKRGRGSTFVILIPAEEAS